jgi:hypothetical protein
VTTKPFIALLGPKEARGVMMQQSASGTGPGAVAPGARLETLAKGFDFTEGPTCDAGGNIFFTDQPNDRILKWSTEGELFHLSAPGRPRQRHVLRSQGPPDRLRR